MLRYPSGPLCAIAFFIFLFSVTGHAQNLGVVDIYRIGRASGFRKAMPLLIDSHFPLEIENQHRLELKMAVGEHLIECKYGNQDAVLALVVKPGAPSNVVLDFEHQSFGRMMVSGGGSQFMKVILEKDDTPPAGDFKDQGIDPALANNVQLLPPYHEPEPLQQAIPIRALSEGDIEEAILQGRHTPDPDSVGLVLEDFGRQFGSALVPGHKAVSGFSIRVYTAAQWIQYLAAVARRDMATFSAADVTAEMRQRLLHVVALPSVPKMLTAENMSVASSVHRIVIEEEPEGTVLQPLSLMPNEIVVDSALRSKSYGGMIGTFPEPDIATPFKIVVIGTGYTKEFEVKDKHLVRLK